MSTEATSLERAIRAEAGGGALLGTENDVEQLDLLRGADGKLPSDVFRTMRARGRGRPEGSGNRRNEKLAKLIVQQHGDPVLYMASLYSMPLDQMIDLVLVADSTAEREERLYGVIDRCEEMIKKLMANPMALVGGGKRDKLDDIGDLLDRITDAAKALKMKPGDLAIKALGLQMGAAKAVSEYVHSKKPVEANLNVGFDQTLLMVAPGGAAPVDAVMAKVKAAIETGAVDTARLRDLRIVDGEFEEIPVEDREDDE